MILIFNPPAVMTDPIGPQRTVVLTGGWAVVSEPNSHKVTIKHAEYTCELPIQIDGLISRLKTADRENKPLDLRGAF